MDIVKPILRSNAGPACLRNLSYCWYPALGAALRCKHNETVFPPHESCTSSPAASPV